MQPIAGPLRFYWAKVFVRLQVAVQIMPPHGKLEQYSQQAGLSTLFVILRRTYISLRRTYISFTMDFVMLTITYDGSSMTVKI
mmetsp:Transcript_15813/g.44052  ORF Transcript_15813/g.44052 Transcript_15813/m.44052 type:complete len:83 (+) Transcript_15813:63-311(+)